MPWFLVAFLALPLDPGAAAAPLSPAATTHDPWRVDSALGTPEWLTLSGHFRARYEFLHNRFRANRSGDADLFSLRTGLRADVNFAPVEGTLELLDSRIFSADLEDPIGTAHANAVEILQGYVVLRVDGALGAENELSVLLGRHTMDIGSRRLVARNRFRNTINAFTGLNATLAHEGGSAVRAFFTLPVRRLPDDFSDLTGNGIEFDEESIHRRFWGLHAARAELFPSVAGELFYYGLQEEDDDFATRNRDLTTVGVRARGQRGAGRADFEIEATAQLGTSRATASTTDTTDLDHLAHFEHAELGYTFDSELSARLAFQFDHASGDRDPNDGENNRFDTLFGARRFDFGPTGILGAFARSNIITPGLRLSIRPSARFDMFAAHRFYYLASRTDAWTTTGVRDPSGGSGHHVGNLAEIRARWHVAPKNVTLEAGVAHLFKGTFARTAPNASPDGDTTYVYVQTIITF